MRRILAIVVIAVAIYFGYRFYTEGVNSVAAEPFVLVTTPEENRPVAISQAIDPLYTKLFIDLDLLRPADLVPPLKLTRERLLKKQTVAGASKREVYAAADRLLTSMIAVAEVRTKVLQSLLKEAAMPSGRLDSPSSKVGSSTFFRESMYKRWENERSRWQPAVEQLRATLIQQEREFNNRVPWWAPSERDEIPRLAPPYLTVDGRSVSQSSLDQRSYNQRQSYRWRNY